MTTTKLLSILLLLTTTASQAGTQRVDGNGNVVPPRSHIILLPNYKVEIRQGIDTHGMSIWKEGGITIDYVQGMYIESDADVIKRTKKRVLWTQEQLVNNQKLVLTYTKSRQLFASFPASRASFSAKIHNQQELADMLLMVVTYSLDGYPIDPSSLAPLPTRPK